MTANGTKNTITASFSTHNSFFFQTSFVVLSTPTFSRHFIDHFPQIKGAFPTNKTSKFPTTETHTLLRKWSDIYLQIIPYYCVYPAGGDWCALYYLTVWCHWSTPHTRTRWKLHTTSRIISVIVPSHADDVWERRRSVCNWQSVFGKRVFCSTRFDSTKWLKSWKVVLMVMRRSSWLFGGGKK